MGQKSSMASHFDTVNRFKSYAIQQTQRSAKTPAHRAEQPKRHLGSQNGDMAMPRLHPRTIDAVRERADIVDVVGEHLALKKKGRASVGV